MIQSTEQLIASGWKQIEPQECCLCGHKPPPYELTPQNDPRQLTLFAAFLLAQLELSSPEES
jgi:hypothetical protein